MCSCYSESAAVLIRDRGVQAPVSVLSDHCRSIMGRGRGRGNARGKGRQGSQTPPPRSRKRTASPGLLISVDDGAPKQDVEPTAAHEKVESVVPDEPPQQCITPRDKKPRRGMFQSADRALKEKFSHIAPERLDAVRNSKGETPAKWVEKEMAANSGKNQYLKSSFWQSLIEEFDLQGTSVFDELPLPEKAQAFDPELLEAIGAAEDSNPSARSPARFLKFFEYASGLNETEIYGALQGSKVRVNVTAKHSQEMQAFWMIDGWDIVVFFVP